MPIASFCFDKVCTDAFLEQYLQLSFVAVCPVVAPSFHIRVAMNHKCPVLLVHEIGHVFMDKSSNNCS